VGARGRRSAAALTRARSRECGWEEKGYEQHNIAIPIAARGLATPDGDLCVALIASGDSVLFPQEAASTSVESLKIPNEQLDSLVAPIALYPDPLLSQTLVASTYPLEIVQLQQWIEKHSNLKPKEMSEAVKTQPWDPSIQAMAVFPILSRT
jgi:hypothetical protein